MAHIASNELNETGEISPEFWAPVVELIEHIEVKHNEEHAKEVKLPLTVKQIIQLQKK